MAIEGRPGPDFDVVATRRAFNELGAIQEVEVADVSDRIPITLRADRLRDQIQLFHHAGYRVETRTRVQAVVVRSRRGPLQRILGAGRHAHRVTITIDREGAVRLS